VASGWRVLSVGGRTTGAQGSSRCGLLVTSRGRDWCAWRIRGRRSSRVASRASGRFRALSWPIGIRFGCLEGRTPRGHNGAGSGEALPIGEGAAASTVAQAGGNGGGSFRGGVRVGGGAGRGHGRGCSGRRSWAAGQGRRSACPSRCWGVTGCLCRRHEAGCSVCQGDDAVVGRAEPGRCVSDGRSGEAGFGAAWSWRSSPT
jgi:hypothetical protein